MLLRMGFSCHVYQDLLSFHESHMTKPDVTGAAAVCLDLEFALTLSPSAATCCDGFLRPAMMPLILLSRLSQDTAGSRMKDRPAAPSPEQIHAVTPPTLSKLPQLLMHCCSRAEGRR